MLAENFIFAKPVFSERFSQLIPAMNSISDLSLVEIQPGASYGKKSQAQSSLEEKCKAVLDQNRAQMETLLLSVKDTMTELRKDIIADDERFEHDIKEAKVREMVKNKQAKNQLVMFHK